MNKLLSYSVFLLVAFNSWQVSAQYELSFLVYDSRDNSPVKEYEIFNVNDGLQLERDQNDVVKTELTVGQVYSFIVFSFEYKTEQFDISIAGDTTIIVNLEALSTQLNQVLISAKRKELFALRNLNPVEGTAIYASKKTERVFIDEMLANKAANNPRQIYARVAGLNIYDASEGGLQLNIGARGLNPNRSANFNMRQNGYDISADVLGYPESYYTPPAEALEEIQFVRGAASLQYGTQFGGLVNFILKDAPAYEGLEISSRQSTGSFGLLNSFNSVGLKKGSIGFYTYFNFKKGEGYRAFSDFESKNLFASVQFNPSENTKISLQHSYFNSLASQAGGLTDLLFEQDPRLALRERNWFLVDWHLTALMYEQKLGEGLRLSGQLSYLDAGRDAVGFRGTPGVLNINPVTQIDEQDNSGKYIYPRDVIQGRFRNLSTEWRLLKNIDFPFSNQKSYVLAGFKYYRANNEAVQGPGSAGSDADFGIRDMEFPDYPSRSKFDFPNENIALFSEAVFALSSKFSITPGIRYEYIRTSSEGIYNRVVFDNAGNPLLNEQLNDDRILARDFILLGLGASFRPTNKSEIYINLTENYRSVTFSDIRVVNPSFIIDPDIRDESGFSFDLGYRGRYKSFLSWDVGSFLIHYDDRIGIIFDDRANRVRKNIGTARIMGIECLLQWNVMRGFLGPESPYLLDVFTNLALSDSKYTRSEENNVVGKKVEFVPELNFKTGINLGYKNVLFGVQWSYVSRQFTDVENSEAAQPGDQSEGLIGPIPSYGILDLSSKWRINKYFSMEAGINNLGNAAYFTQRATGYPGPGIIPSYGRNYYLTLAFNLSQSKSKS